MKNLSSKIIILGLFVICITLAGIWAVMKKKPPANLNRDKVAKAFTVAEVNDKDIIWGNPDAPITIIQYSDIQCPACAYFHKIISSTKRLVEDDVRIIFRHFPLMNIHPHALLAAQYVEAARKQKTHIQLIDMLYETQKEWSSSENPRKIFSLFAKKLNMDLNQLEEELKNPEIKEKINQDILSGLQAEISGTPTFFMNRKKINFPNDPQKFFKFVQKQKKLLEKKK